MRARSLLELYAHRLREPFCRDERDLERPRAPRVDAELVRLVTQQFQERRCADVPGHVELGEDLRLHVGVLGPRRDHRASRRDELVLDPVPSRSEVIAQRVQDDVVLAEPHGVEGERERCLAPLRRRE